VVLARLAAGQSIPKRYLCCLLLIDSTAHWHQQTLFISGCYCSPNEKSRRSACVRSRPFVSTKVISFAFAIRQWRPLHWNAAACQLCPEKSWFCKPTQSTHNPCGFCLLDFYRSLAGFWLLFVERNHIVLGDIRWNNSRLTLSLAKTTDKVSIALLMLASPRLRFYFWCNHWIQAQQALTTDDISVFRFMIYLPGVALWSFFLCHFTAFYCCSLVCIE